VAPELPEEVTDFHQCSVERNARNAAPGSARAIPLQGEEQHGPVVFPRQPRGRDSEDAAVPGRVSLDDQRIPLGVEGSRDALAGLREHAPFDRLALRIAGAQLAGDLGSARRVPLLEDRQREVGRVQAAGRVQSGSDPEGDLLGGGRLAGCDPARFEERGETRGAGPGERRETQSRDRAVLTGQGNDVRDRTEARRPQQRIAGQPDPGASRDRLRELERDPGPRELLVGIVAPRLPRVDDDRALRQLVGDQVMVGDDDVDALFAGEGNAFDRGDPAVDGHDDRGRKLANHAGDRLGSEPVPVLQPVRQEGHGTPADPRESCLELRDCRHAVHVVVAEDHHAAAGPRGREKQVRRFPDAAHPKGVVQLRFVRVEEALRIGGARDSAGREEPAHDRRQPRRARQGVSRVGGGKVQLRNHFGDDVRQ
jgi:hypothetical protein